MGVTKKTSKVRAVVRKFGHKIKRHDELSLTFQLGMLGPGAC